MSTDGHNTDFVVVAIIARDGKIFIARRAATKAHWPNRFELPGGHVEPGETLEAALAREIMEEIGVEVEIGQIADAFTYQSEDIFKVEICYLCRLKDGQDPVLNPDDHSEAKWIGPDEVDLFEKDDDETNAVQKAFKILEGEQ